MLVVPSAATLAEGEAGLGASRHAPDDRATIANGLFAIGFAPGFELGGRLAESTDTGLRDLSFHAKLQLWRFDNGAAVAIGGQDLAGEVRPFRNAYAVATIPWRTLHLTAGYGRAATAETPLPDPPLLEGAIGGVEWRPSSQLSALVEHDGRDVNGAVRFGSGQWLGRLRLQLTAGYRGNGETEFGVGLTFPLGKTAPPPAPKPASAAPGPGIRAELERLGFESVRVGTRDGTVIAQIENRRYNHASVDGIGLALGVLAQRAPPEMQQVEVALLTYGVPQLTVAAPAEPYRSFLAGGPAPPLDARQVSRFDAAAWDGPARGLRPLELVVEPVLRTFVGTEYGVADYGLGGRARLTVPLADGVLLNTAVQAPLARSDDFGPGRNFGAFAPRAGLDTGLLQWLVKAGPSLPVLASAGRTRVYREDLTTAALEPLWLSPRGVHQLHAKLMVLDGRSGTHRVALADYTWYDAARGWSVTLKGGRFYAGDAGGRIDVSRYFGDTIATLFFKAAARDEQAAGFALSLPLTPRRDAFPAGVQLKGPRRWGHFLSTTLNADGGNVLRPLLLYEPQLDMDLREDLLDGGRLTPDFIVGQSPRLRDAYERWGTEGAAGR